MSMAGPVRGPCRREGGQQPAHHGAVGVPGLGAPAWLTVDRRAADQRVGERLLGRGRNRVDRVVEGPGVVRRGACGSR